MFYSATQNQCFPSALRADYERNGTWPADAVEIPDALYKAVVTDRPANKIMTPGTDGLPILVDPPVPTDADVAAQVRAERDARMRAFEWRYERYHRELRLAQPTADTLVDLDAHMQALANVPEQTGFPRAVKWPVYPPVTAPSGGVK